MALFSFRSGSEWLPRIERACTELVKQVFNETAHTTAAVAVGRNEGKVLNEYSALRRRREVEFLEDLPGLSEKLRF